MKGATVGDNKGSCSVFILWSLYRRVDDRRMNKARKYFVITRLKQRFCALHEMFGVQSGKVRPCDLRKLARSLSSYFLAEKWCWGGAWGFCFTKWRRKICFGIDESFPLRSTRSNFAHRKSAPNREWDTSVMVKSHLYCFVVKRSAMVRFRNVWIVLPLEATNEGTSCAVRIAILMVGKNWLLLLCQPRTGLQLSCLLRKAGHPCGGRHGPYWCPACSFPGHPHGRWHQWAFSPNIWW